MDSGCESYRRFREEGDQEALAEIIRVCRDGLFAPENKKRPEKTFGSDGIRLDNGANFW